MTDGRAADPQGRAARALARIVRAADRTVVVDLEDGRARSVSPPSSPPAPAPTSPATSRARAAGATRAARLRGPRTSATSSPGGPHDRRGRTRQTRAPRPVPTRAPAPSRRTPAPVERRAAAGVRRPVLDARQLVEPGRGRPPIERYVERLDGPRAPDGAVAATEREFRATVPHEIHVRSQATRSRRLARRARAGAARASRRPIARPWRATRRAASTFRMRRTTAARPSRGARKPRDRALLAVVTGDGKGKSTSSAFGMLLRAWTATTAAPSCSSSSPASEVGEQRAAEALGDIDWFKMGDAGADQPRHHRVGRPRPGRLGAREGMDRRGAVRVPRARRVHVPDEVGWIDTDR